MVSVFRKIDSPGQQLRLNVTFGEDNFILVIFDKCDAWKAEISWNSIKKAAEQLELDAEEYYSTLKLYLQDYTNNVQLKLVKNEFICYYNENGIRVKYFSCKPKKVEFNEYVYDLLDEFALNNDKLKEQNLENKAEITELKKDHAKLEEKLAELVSRKVSEENELYSNFVLVLNEKKRKIQHLTQILQAFKAGRPVLNPEIKPKKPSKKEIKQEQRHVSESDSSDNSDGYNTDEDRPKNAEDITKEVLPSTSKKHDYDMVFQESEEAVSLPKRRREPDGSKEIYETSVTAKVLNTKKETMKELEVDKEEDSPTATFNTQELLDCI